MKERLVCEEFWVADNICVAGVVYWVVLENFNDLGHNTANKLYLPRFELDFLLLWLLLLFLALLLFFFVIINLRLKAKARLGAAVEELRKVVVVFLQGPETLIESKINVFWTFDLHLIDVFNDRVVIRVDRAF